MGAAPVPTPFVQEVQDDSALHTVAAGDIVFAAIFRLFALCRKGCSHPCIFSIVLLLISMQVKLHSLQQVRHIVAANFVDGQGGFISLAGRTLVIQLNLISGGNHRASHQHGGVAYFYVVPRVGSAVNFVGVHHNTGCPIRHGKGVGVLFSLRCHHRKNWSCVRYIFAQIVIAPICRIVCEQLDGIGKQRGRNAIGQGQGVLQLQPVALRVQVLGTGVDGHIVVNQVVLPIRQSAFFFQRGLAVRDRGFHGIFGNICPFHGVRDSFGFPLGQVGAHVNVVIQADNTAPVGR